MLLKKLWRTMGLYRAQFISMVIMITLGVGVFVGFNMEWVSIEKNTSSFFEKTGLADYKIVSETGFTSDDVASVSKIDGIDAAARFVSIAADVKGFDGDAVTLAVTENEKINGFTVTDGSSYDALGDDGIWLSDKYAASNGVKLGDKLTLVYKNIEISGEVRGLVKSGEYLICVRDESQLMPDSDTHGFAYISPEMYKKTVGFEYYPQICVLSDLEKDEFTEKVDSVLGSTLMILTRDEDISYAGASGEIDEGKTTGSVLPVLFLLIAVLTMVTTMHRLAAKEKIQIGTLKALGFKDRRIIRHYTSYAAMIGVAGSVVGCALGYGIAWYIMNPNGMMGTYMDMPEWKLYMPVFCAVTVVCIVLLMTFIGYLSVKQMLRGTAADALRPYSPKKVKPLLIEKTKFFHRLPFGTRWNMRDTMRHKSRTAMSLIGTVGCMVLIVCALGMKDTMKSFLDIYYNKAMNYASRIYISEDASESAVNSLTDKYAGDTSKTISVQIEDKAVSLDIFDISDDNVRFIDKKNNFVSLSDDGAYICERIADEFGLKKGDTFTVSPYGDDKEYELRVAGMLRSVSENISVSRTYAEKLGFEYIPDSIYTKTEKGDIVADDGIKSVQSKQMIMDSFDSFMELMNLSVAILIIGALGLGFVVLYNLGVMSYTERYREMATLKVVGFGDGKIASLLIGQNLWISIVGIIVGLPLGAGVLVYLVKALASEYEMKAVLGPLTYIFGILLTLSVSLFVSARVAKKNRKIDMVEALKGAE